MIVALSFASICWAKKKCDASEPSQKILQQVKLRQVTSRHFWRHETHPINRKYCLSFNSFFCSEWRSPEACCKLLAKKSRWKKYLCIISKFDLYLVIFHIVASSIAACRGLAARRTFECFFMNESVFLVLIHAEQEYLWPRAKKIWPILKQARVKRLLLNWLVTQMSSNKAKKVKVVFKVMQYILKEPNTFSGGPYCTNVRW